MRAAAAVCVASAAALTAAVPAAAQQSESAALRVVGADIYETAAMLAGGRCDSRSGDAAVVLATGENWPDALAAAALDRPLLYTRKNFLPAATRSYLEPCGPSHDASVVVLGSEAAVSAEVVDVLASMGYETFRFGGRDRYETARIVASVSSPAVTPVVYLASGANFADAVAATPFVSQDTPLLLTEPGRLSGPAREFLSAGNRTIGVVTVLGSAAAVSDKTVGEVEALGVPTRRVGGADRYFTAAMLAEDVFRDDTCRPVVDVAVVSGTQPWDGLAAAASRDRCRPVLLAPPAGQPPHSSLAAWGRTWRHAVGSSTTRTVTAVGTAMQVPDHAVTAVLTGDADASDVAAPVTKPDRGPEPDSDGFDAAVDWETVAESVVLVECRHHHSAWMKLGTGFAVGGGRHVVTNHHVVHDDNGTPCDRVTIGVGGTLETAPSVRVDASIERVTGEDRDLALLLLDSGAASLPPVVVSAAASRIGDTLSVLGYPGVGGNSLTLTSGSYSGTRHLNGFEWIKTDARISGGNSGGPVFNAQGEVVGVATLAHDAEIGDGLNFLVPATDVAKLIAGQIGGPPTDAFGPAAPPAPVEGFGAWETGTATNTGAPYLSLNADSHTLEYPYDNLTPALSVWCGDYAQLDFWNPAYQDWRGPYIGGQIAYGEPHNGMVPVGWRLGDTQTETTYEYWNTDDASIGLLFSAADSGLVHDLMRNAGRLSFGYANFDSTVTVIEFLDTAGFVAAYSDLQRRCVS